MPAYTMCFCINDKKPSFRSCRPHSRRLSDDRMINGRTSLDHFTSVAEPCAPKSCHSVLPRSLLLTRKHQNHIRTFNVSGGAGGLQNRATPLAAGGGAHDEGVGGVVSHTTLSDASSRINVTDNSALGLPRADIRIACSKGTYVRAFARDLGEALGSGAHLDSLLRSRSGIFRIENALTVEQTISLLASDKA